jgi:hypothetical protein
MIKKERDSKFIIYEVLYIFVITVLALKGADLSLNRVVSKDKVVSKTVRDSLVAVIDSLYSKGINFDIKVNENVSEENTQLKEKVEKMKTQLASLDKRIKEIPPEQRVQQPEQKPKTEETINQAPISTAQTFIQYTWNIATNNGNVPTSIYDPKDMSHPIVTVNPGEQKKFNLDGESEVIAKFGSQEQTIKVVPNKPPKIDIESVTTQMNNSDIYVQDLQRITVYKVTIIDERPDQLKITYSGPISVSGPYKDSNGDPVYNVSLKIASTESLYEQWLDRNNTLRDSNGRYKVNFFFIAYDPRTKDRVQVGEPIYFTDFSR